MNKYQTWAWKRAILNVSLSLRLMWLEIDLSLHLPVPFNGYPEKWNSAYIHHEPSDGAPGTISVSLFFIHGSIGLVSDVYAPIGVNVYVDVLAK